MEVTTTMRPVMGSRPRTLLLAVVVAIVLGVLGMHALSPHGSGAAVTDTKVTGEAAMHTHGGHTGVEATVHQPGAPAHDMDNMVMLCVAMVASAAVSLLMLFLISRVPTSWVLARARLRAVFAHPTPAVFGAGPPPGWAFSVVRC